MRTHPKDMVVGGRPLLDVSHGELIHHYCKLANAYGKLLMERGGGINPTVANEVVFHKRLGAFVTDSGHVPLRFTKVEALTDIAMAEFSRASVVGGPTKPTHAGPVISTAYQAVVTARAALE